MARNKEPPVEPKDKKSTGGKTPRTVTARTISRKVTHEHVARVKATAKERRPYGSVEGRVKRQTQFLRVVYGGINKGDDRRPSGGRLAQACKAIEFLAQTLDREGNEFTHSQGVSIINTIKIEVKKLRKVIQDKAKPNQIRLV